MAIGGHRGKQNKQKIFKHVIITPVGQLALAKKNNNIILMRTGVPANFGNIC